MTYYDRRKIYVMVSTEESIMHMIVSGGMDLW